MADEIDRAAEIAEASTANAIAAHAARQRPTPAEHCEDCEDELEPHRVEFGTCVCCQRIREQRTKNRRG